GDVEHLLETLHAMEPAERRTVEGLNPDRADIIVAGLAVVAEVMARLEARDVQVSRYGIREGILLEAARIRPVVADPGEARDRSVRELAERCHYELPHATNVQRLALRLFDSFGLRLRASPVERSLLGGAAPLPDVGYHLGHHR